MSLYQEAVPKKKKFLLFAILVVPFVLLVGCGVMPNGFVGQEHVEPLVQDINGSVVGNSERKPVLSISEQPEPPTMVFEQFDYMDTYLASWPEELAVDSSKAMLSAALPESVASPTAKLDNDEVVTDEIIVSEIPPGSVEMVEQDEIAAGPVGPVPSLLVNEVRREEESPSVSVIDGTLPLESGPSSVMVEEGEGRVDDFVDVGSAPHRIGIKSVGRGGVAAKRDYYGARRQSGLAYKVPGVEKSGE